ncbi:AzlC family ABC transporter permease [Rugosimonospora africana]|nr:AzlC family ABC transporter permease [Rugosimonospora africana]
MWRTADRALIRDIAAIVAADCFVGMSFGAIAVASGLPLWAAVAMSILIFAGGAQFLAASLVAAGNPVAAVLGGLLLNARHLPFGMAVGDVLGRGATRLAGSHIMVDESVAFALAQPDPRKRRAAYWLTGVALFVAWNAGGLVGAMVGSAIGDPGTFGLDAAFPAGLFALLLPTLIRARDQSAAAPARPASTGGAPAGDGTAGGVTAGGVAVGGVTASGGAAGSVTVDGGAAGSVTVDGGTVGDGSGTGRDPAAPWVAGAGALIAVAATPLVPAGLPVLLALAALGLAFVVPVRKAAVTC